MNNKILSFKFKCLLLLFTFLCSLFLEAMALENIPAGMFNEAPILRLKVISKLLPPIDNRLPLNPMIVQPVEKIGKYGGTWRLGMKRNRDHAVFIRYLAYENLLRWDSNWTKVLPNVAQSFKSNPNSTEYTFQLRRNMRWSDGELFTADDIMFWYEDILLNKGLVTKFPSALMVNGKQAIVKKIDNYTVKFIFDAPYGLFPQILAQAHLIDATTYPKHYLKQFLPKYNPEINQLVHEAKLKNWSELFISKFGTPVTIDDPSRWRNPELPTLYAWIQKTPYLPEVEKIYFERNPYYWKVDTAGNQLPYIDKVECTTTNTAEQVAALAIAGRIDMQRRRMDAKPKREFESAMREHRFGFFETLSSFSNTMVIALNLTHNDPVKREIFRNKDFRIGLSHAIDRKLIADNVPGMSGKPFQPSPRPETPFYDQEFSTQYTEYKVSLANQYLDQAGYAKKDTKGFRLGPNNRLIEIEIEFNDFISGWEKALQIVVRNWQEVGVSAKIKNYTRDLLYERKTKNLHDAVVWLGDGGMSVILEPRWYLPYSQEANYAPLWQRWYNSESGSEVPPEQVKTQMQLYDQLKATADKKMQFQLMKKVLAIAKEQFYAIGISLPVSSIGVVKNNFHNVPTVMPYGWIYPTPGPTNTSQYYKEE